jgi:hypothetical protein
MALVNFGGGIKEWSSDQIWLYASLKYLYLLFDHILNLIDGPTQERRVDRYS